MCNGDLQGHGGAGVSGGRRGDVQHGENGDCAEEGDDDRFKALILKRKSTDYY